MVYLYHLLLVIYSMYEVCGYMAANLSLSWSPRAIVSKHQAATQRDSQRAPAGCGPRQILDDKHMISDIS